MSWQWRLLHDIFNKAQPHVHMYKVGRSECECEAPLHLGHSNICVWAILKTHSFWVGREEENKQDPTRRNEEKGAWGKGAFTCCHSLFTLTTEFLWSAFKQYQFIENVRHKSRYHCHQLLYNLCVYKKNEKLTSFSLMHFSSLEEACNKSLTKWRRRTF